MNITGRAPYAKGQKPAKVPALRNASRAMDCLLAIPGVCRNDPAYVVGAHLRLFGIAGGAQKPDDLFIIDACDRCHEVQERRSKWADAQLGFEDVLRGLMQSQLHRRASGLIILKGESL
jgi:hypothetical protein